MKQPLLLNIRIPFVSLRPSFGNSFLIEGRDSKLIHKYALALAVELKANAAEFIDYEIQAIRFDGGSASILSGEDTERLIRFIRTSYNIKDGISVSMQTCPADINGANMPFYNRINITRYDLEMYSLEPADFIYLKTMNYNELLPYISKGFLHAENRNNMGFILLYGKKSISKYGFRRSVLETIRRPISHVILQRCEGEDCLNDADTVSQLQMAAQLFEKAGYHEYLPCHWAKEKCEDPFFVGKALKTDILGVGLGAVTVLDKIRSRNTSDLTRYLENSGNYELITEAVNYD